MKYIAHRGYSAKYVENTIDAFNATLEHPQHGNSIIGIELDIQMTGDNKIIVYHDLKITENEISRSLCDITLQELQGHFSRKHPAGSLRVPTLKETLEFINHRTTLFIEIKDNNYDVEVFIHKLNTILNTYSCSENIVLHSFSTAILRKCFSEITVPGIQYGFLFSEIERLTEQPDSFIEKLNFLHPLCKCLLENNTRIFNYGLPLHTWTVNDPETVTKIEEIDSQHLVNAVITDDLALA